jgi:hypothetical protein
MDVDLRNRRLMYITLISLFITTSIESVVAQPVNTKKVPNLGGGMFSVSVTIFGIYHDIGDIVTFVHLKNATKALAFNTTKLDMKDGKVDGIGEITFKFSHIVLKDSDEIKACNIMVKNSDIVCSTTEIPSADAKIAFIQLYLNSEK